MTRGRHSSRGRRRKSGSPPKAFLGAAPLLMAAIFSPGTSEGEPVTTVAASEPGAAALHAGAQPRPSAESVPVRTETSVVSPPAKRRTTARTATRTTTRASRLSTRQAAGTQSTPSPTPTGTRRATSVRITNTAGPVKRHVQTAANKVYANVPGIRSIGGTRRSSFGEHGLGLALDFMCSKAVGDAVAKYLRAHWSELNVDYVIWRQRILRSPNGSWDVMEDRGSTTANHMDHVHVTFRP